MGEAAERRIRPLVEPIKTYLEQELLGRPNTSPSTTGFCAIAPLGLRTFRDSIEAYIWTYCGAFEKSNGMIRMVSGSSQPVAVTLQEGRVTGHRTPEAGSGYGKMVKAIFPKALQSMILDQNLFKGPMLPASPEKQAEKALGAGLGNFVGTVVLPGAATPVAIDAEAVYALVRAPKGGQATVARIDRRTREVVRSGSIDNVFAATLARGRLWVAATEDGKNRPVLVGLNPQTLKPLSKTAIPSNPSDPAQHLPLTLAGTASRLWAGAGSTLHEIDASGKIVKSTPGEAPISSLAAAPDSENVYVARYTEDQQILVTMVDPATGSVAEYKGRSALAGGRLAATDKGVWLSYRTGSLGEVVRLDNPAPGSPPPPDPEPAFTGSARIGAFTTPDLWITDLDKLSCGDPATGKIGDLAGWQVDGAGAVVGEGGTVYVESSSGLLEFVPDRICSIAQLKAALAGDWVTCTNSRIGFTISRPRAWHTLAPELNYSKCQYFEPVSMAGVTDPEGTALTVMDGPPLSSVPAPEFPESQTLRSEALTINGRKAVLTETELIMETHFSAGTRYYGYRVDFGTKTIYVGTSGFPQGNPELYEIYKQVVDRAVRSLELFE